jgi:DNA/RNA-binding domain of Phe-tRNA-synthetase-like protein
MDFQHSSEIWRDFPELVPGVVFAKGITPDAAAGDRVAKFTDIARSRLEREPESELPEIRAWRRAFTRMGLKPTQYRCASEALQEGRHPSAVAPARRRVQRRFSRVRDPGGRL